MTNYQNHTLKNKHGLTVTIGNIGAVIQSIKLPDGTELVLGFDSLADYQTKNTTYLGTIMGRISNRIANSGFAIDETYYQLESNEDHKNILHSGSSGLHLVIWKIIECTAQRIKLHYFSPDGAGGFPGNVDILVTYQLNDDNALQIDYSATTDQITPLDLTNHTYWNLAGAGQTIFEQEAKFYAGHYLELNQEQLPTGKILSTKNTPLDFHHWRKIGEVDNYFILDKPLSRASATSPAVKYSRGEVKLAAEIRDRATNRKLTVFTDQPGFQFYTGKHLQDFPSYGGFCVETHKYPNAVNETHFPSPLITPEKPYRQTTVYQLSF